VVSALFFDMEIGFGSVWFLAVLRGWLGAGLRDCAEAFVMSRGGMRGRRSGAVVRAVVPWVMNGLVSGCLRDGWGCVGERVRVGWFGAGWGAPDVGVLVGE
jgi:hypothetical protein